MQLKLQMVEPVSGERFHDLTIDVTAKDDFKDLQNKVIAALQNDLGVTLTAAELSQFKFRNTCIEDPSEPGITVDEKNSHVPAAASTCAFNTVRLTHNSTTSANVMAAIIKNKPNYTWSPAVIETWLQKSAADILANTNNQPHTTNKLLLWNNNTAAALPTLQVQLQTLSTKIITKSKTENNHLKTMLGVPLAENNTPNLTINLQQFIPAEIIAANQFNGSNLLNAIVDKLIDPNHPDLDRLCNEVAKGIAPDLFNQFLIGFFLRAAQDQKPNSAITKLLSHNQLHPQHLQVALAVQMFKDATPIKKLIGNEKFNDYRSTITFGDTKNPGLVYLASHKGVSESKQSVNQQRIGAFNLISGAIPDDKLMQRALTRTVNLQAQHINDLPGQVVVPHSGEKVPMIATSGSTLAAAVCFKNTEKQLTAVTAQVGDAHAQALTSTNKMQPIITASHTTSNPNEVDRLEKKGGIIYDDKVEGEVSTTRSLGNTLYKGIIAQSEIHTEILGNGAEIIIGSNSSRAVFNDQKLTAKYRNNPLDTLQKATQTTSKNPQDISFAGTDQLHKLQPGELLIIHYANGNGPHGDVVADDSFKHFKVDLVRSFYFEKWLVTATSYWLPAILQKITDSYLPSLETNQIIAGYVGMVDTSGNAWTTTFDAWSNALTNTIYTTKKDIKTPDTAKTAFAQRLAPHMIVDFFGSDLVVKDDSTFNSQPTSNAAPVNTETTLQYVHPSNGNRFGNIKINLEPGDTFEKLQDKIIAASNGILTRADITSFKFRETDDLSDPGITIDKQNTMVPLRARRGTFNTIRLNPAMKPETIAAIFTAIINHESASTWGPLVISHWLQTSAENIVEQATSQLKRSADHVNPYLPLCSSDIITPYDSPLQPDIITLNDGIRGKHNSERNILGQLLDIAQIINNTTVSLQQFIPVTTIEANQFNGHNLLNAIVDKLIDPTHADLDRLCAFVADKIAPVLLNQFLTVFFLRTAAEPTPCAAINKLLKFAKSNPQHQPVNTAVQMWKNAKPIATPQDQQYDNYQTTLSIGDSKVSVHLNSLKGTSNQSKQVNQDRIGAFSVRVGITDRPLLERVLAQTNQLLVKLAEGYGVDSGSTLTTVVCRNENPTKNGKAKITALAGQTGDSGAKIISPDAKAASGVNVQPLTLVAHKGTDAKEVARVRAAGGIIVKGRIMGELAVTRAIGDTCYDEVISEPEFNYETLPEGAEIFAASDGVVDTLDNDQIATQWGKDPKQISQHAFEVQKTGHRIDDTSGLHTIGIGNLPPDLLLFLFAADGHGTQGHIVSDLILKNIKVNFIKLFYFQTLVSNFKELTFITILTVLDGGRDCANIVAAYLGDCKDFESSAFDYFEKLLAQAIYNDDTHAKAMCTFKPVPAAALATSLMSGIGGGAVVASADAASAAQLTVIDDVDSDCLTLPRVRS